ncbi:MAG: GNAT family N-acetyltransferase [Chloroflexi bacterium]|nr:MAG: GNAT family N-acetyltransferase [Chloroflexota bacterium]
MIRYRDAMREDATTIATLHAESWRVTYRGSYRDEFLDGPVFQDRMGVWNKRLSMPAPNQFVVLAEEEGLVVGFACAYGRDDEQWGSLLDNIHVRRQQHRQGVGTGLASEVARWCRANYTDCGLYLWVIAQNHQARRFYERLGATDQRWRGRTARCSPLCVDGAHRHRARSKVNIVNVRAQLEPTASLRVAVAQRQGR